MAAWPHDKKGNIKPILGHRRLSFSLFFPFFFAELLLMDGCSLLPVQGLPAPVQNAYYYNLNPIQQYAV